MGLANTLPPSSVITTTVVLGPRPSGLNTCSDTKYCVKMFSFWIVYFTTLGSFILISFTNSDPTEFLGLKATL